MHTFLPDPALLDSPRGRPWPAHPDPSPPSRSDPLPDTASVVVIGSGPAGVAVVSALWHHGVRDVVVIDREDRACGRFLGRIDRLGQRVLRSPYEHHPGVEGFRDCELLDHARLHWGLLTGRERREVRMAQAGHRSVVPVDVFTSYCEHLVATHGVSARRWRAEVRGLDPDDGGVVVRAVAGGRPVALRAEHAVLCPGEERREAPEAWWGGGTPPAGVHHWDEPAPSDGGGRVVVVGAGLTAAHLVAGALASGSAVDWVLRSERERYQCADVNARFFRPEGRARFDGRGGVGPWSDRLALLRTHRRASVMFEFRPGLERAEACGDLVVHRGRPVVSVDSVGGSPGVTLTDGRRIGGDRVTLALGTRAATGSALLRADVVGERDGWPDLDARTLAYVRAPRVHAVGSPAGMVLGPAARNLDGHRVATARVATAIAEGLRRGTPLASAADPGAAPGPITDVVEARGGG